MVSIRIILSERELRTTGEILCCDTLGKANGKISSNEIIGGICHVIGYVFVLRAKQFPTVLPLAIEQHIISLVN